MRLAFTRPQLRVYSAVLCNLSVVWIAAIFATRDLATLTANIVNAIVSLYLAIKIEEVLVKYYD